MHGFIKCIIVFHVVLAAPGVCCSLGPQQSIQSVLNTPSQRPTASCHERSYQCSVKDAIDNLSSWRSGSKEPTAEELGEQVLQHARDEAVRTGKHRVVTAAEPGLEVLYTETLRNERVPVASISPVNAEDWSGECAPPCTLPCIALQLRSHHKLYP